MKVYPLQFTVRFNNKNSGQRIAEIKSIENKANPTWNDFVTLEAQLGKEKRPQELGFVGFFREMFGDLTDLSYLIVDAMDKILETINPQKLSYPYSESNLVALMARPILRGSGSGYTGVDWRHEGEIKAAQVLAKIVKKIGKILEDEPEIIKQMLDLASACEVGAALVADSFDHPWRFRIKETTIIESIIYFTYNKPSSDLYQYNPNYVLRNLLYGITKATELNHKEKVDVGYIYNNDLIKALLMCSKKDDLVVRSNAIYFMQVINGISSFADSEFEGIFINGILNDPKAEIKIPSMDGIIHILDRKKIKDIRLEKALELLIDHENSKVRETALRTIGKYLEVSSID